MADLTQDLAALRLEREPEPEPSRRWLGWVFLVVVLAAAGVGA